MSIRGQGRLVLIATLAAAAAVTLGASVPALAGDDFNPLGDGSGFANLDLVRDPTTGCENCAPDPPHEWDAPWFDIDWELGLRGAYVHTPTIDYFEATLAPRVTLHHENLRGGYDFHAGAEISRSTIEDVRLGIADVGFAGTYQLDTDTALAGSLDLAMTRESANAPGSDPNILVEPLVLSGALEGSVARGLGPLIVIGTANLDRTNYGPTTMVGPIEVDNSDQSNWFGKGALRVGYEVTPILTAFVDGSIAHQWYDAVSPTYLVRLDATDYQARTGLSVVFNELIEGETSIGYGLRRFDAMALGEASSVLYDANLTVRPDETLEIRGAFTTTFGAPGANTGGTTRLEYAAIGDIVYTVNPWLSLRATAGWRHALLIGTPDTEDGWNAGVGADYVLNEFTTVNADYNYSWGESTPDPAEDEHRVTVGLTFHR